jgi:hypothetical protein
VLPDVSWKVTVPVAVKGPTVLGLSVAVSVNDCPRFAGPDGETARPASSFAG